jgi:GT2 family glycosyltransferase
VNDDRRPLEGESGAGDLEPTAPIRPRVSIVIPVFNGLALTRVCLEAILRHTPPELYELIVVDNGSSDGTAAWLRERQEQAVLRAVANADNRGFAIASNQGARAARGEYLLMLNNDTEPELDWLEPLVAVLDQEPTVGAVGAKLLYPDRTIQHAGVIVVDHQRLGDPLLALHIFARLPEDHPDANASRSYKAVTAACMLVRREAFFAVGGFDEGYWNGYEDVDLCFALARSGFSIRYEPRSVVIHHESQSGPERWRCARENVERLHRKWLGRVVPDAVVGR